MDFPGDDDKDDDVWYTVVYMIVVLKTAGLPLFDLSGTRLVP